jgi:hypothetical protein
MAHVSRPKAPCWLCITGRHLKLPTTLAMRWPMPVCQARDTGIQHGKFVFEAKPEDANKGRALARMMQELPFPGGARS